MATDKVPLYGVVPEEWMEDPRIPCKGLGFLFFPPEKASKGVNEDWDLPARAICRTCPHQVTCLEYAMRNHLEGIWGGSSETERRSIQRRRRHGPDRPCPNCESPYTGPRFKSKQKANHRVCASCGCEFQMVNTGRHGGTNYKIIKQEADAI